jgi:hypothetical protein
MNSEQSMDQIGEGNDGRDAKRSGMANKPNKFGDNGRQKLALEFQKAEQVMQKAKYDVAEQEYNLKDDRARNKKMREDVANLEKQLIEIQDQFDEDFARNATDIENKKNRNASNAFFIKKLIETYALKIKLRKMWRMKILSIGTTLFPPTKIPGRKLGTTW